jgi:hypothetical protein
MRGSGQGGRFCGAYVPEKQFDPPALLNICLHERSEETCCRAVKVSAAP